MARRNHTDEAFPWTIECDGCGTDFEADRPNVDLCHDCALGRSRANAEPPEGGWPRGSDMDRI